MSMKSSHTDARSAGIAGAATDVASLIQHLSQLPVASFNDERTKGRQRVPPSPLNDQFRASRSRVLLEVLAHQLGHFEHAHGTLAAEHFLQRGIRVDVPLVL